MIGWLVKAKTVSWFLNRHRCFKLSIYFPFVSFFLLFFSLICIVSLFNFLKAMDSSILNRCPHRSEVQSIALAETDSEWILFNLIVFDFCTLSWGWIFYIFFFIHHYLLENLDDVFKLFSIVTLCLAGSGNMVLGSVDSYGHLIVSKLDTSGKGACCLNFCYASIVQSKCLKCICNVLYMYVGNYLIIACLRGYKYEVGFFVLLADLFNLCHCCCNLWINFRLFLFFVFRQCFKFCSRFALLNLQSSIICVRVPLSYKSFHCFLN